MFLSAILLALIVGALAGGGLPRLADLRLRWLWLLGIALALRVIATFGREVGIAEGLPIGAFYIGAYLFIFGWLWGNWRVPGLQIASVGIASNALAVIINGGQMPIWSGAFLTAGFTPADIANDPFHFVLEADTVAAFVAAGGLFGDVIPVPVPFIRDVVSIGDVILALGIFWAIVYSMTRPEAPARASVAVGTMTPAMVGVGGAAGTFQSGAAYGGAVAVPAEPAARPEMGLRGQSPYLRLVRNRNFSLLWVGQVVSLIGDRIHIIALPFLVLGATNDAMLMGVTFAMTALPNVLLGPLAGTFVDRWDRRRTMIGADLVRAALVLAVPLAITIHIGLVLALTFTIATVTLLFRPAKTAVIPAIVDDRDLVTANSATSIADSAADLLGLPLAGILAAMLASNLGLAFVLDSGTYLLSAIFIWAMVVPRDPDVGSDEPFSVGAVWREMVEGWRFLQRNAALFSNTVISTVAQLAVGAEIVASVPYAKFVLDTTTLDSELAYALLLTSIAVGSVVAGVLLGALGERLPKGPAIIGGFVVMGLSLVAAGLTSNPYLAIGAFFFTGLGNMLFLVPTITMFQQQTPQRLMGRVVSARQALVFGAIALSMAVSGALSDAIGPDTVLMAFGAICAVAGAAGLAIPAMRGVR
jgi:DHA3 family macrolide efflux protein-like MFS transporter